MLACIIIEIPVLIPSLQAFTEIKKLDLIPQRVCSFNPEKERYVMQKIVATLLAMLIAPHASADTQTLLNDSLKDSDGDGYYSLLCGLPATPCSKEVLEIAAYLPDVFNDDLDDTNARIGTFCSIAPTDIMCHN